MRFQVADPNLDPDKWTEIDANGPAAAALAYAQVSLDPHGYDRPFPITVRGPRGEATVFIRPVPAHFEVA